MALKITPEMRELLECAARRGVETAKIALGSPLRSTRTKRPKDDEHAIQSAFFASVLGDPELSALPIYAVPNFAGFAGRERTRIVQGARAKAAGRRKGVPDVSIDVARGGWHGLRIEFKAGAGSPSSEQRTWRDMLQRQGFRVVVCRSCDEALELLRLYLSLGAFVSPVSSRVGVGSYPENRLTASGKSQPAKTAKKTL